MTLASDGRLGDWFDFLFFFQAEDGIRDLTVTGVQTCALPISDLGLLVTHLAVRPRSLRGAGRLDEVRGAPGRPALGHIPGESQAVAPEAHLRGGRSEERRVGKECRSRWSPYH